MRNENVPKRFEFQIFVLKYDSLKLMHKSKNLPKTGKDFFFLNGVSTMIDQI